MKCFMTHQDCIYEKDIQQSLSSKSEKSLFVVSPFGYPYDEIYRNIIVPAGRDADIEVRRADVAFQLGFVMCTKICKLMQQAEYVIADLTKDNPNVFYELGLAWGFGKKVVILRDMEVPFSDRFREILGDPEQKILSYEELWDLRARLSRKEPAKLAELLERKAIDVQGECEIEGHCAQGAYIGDKRISVCYRTGRPDAKFYLETAQDAIAGVADNETKKKETRNKEDESKERRNKEIPENNAAPERWKLAPLPIGGERLAESVPKEGAALAESLPRKLSSSKVVIVDVTHYDNKADTAIYFVLGLSHAMGRETIPITNRARYSDISPFDVRGLWQVYFDSLEQLKSGLVGILEVISPEYDRERHDYPLRFIWDRVLAHGGLSVITCSRGAKSEKDRPGGRTQVDKWDYASVAELASFLGKKYKQAEIIIEPPREKAKIAGLWDESGRSKRVERIAKDLRDEPKSIIIVGSPDVNDYAEIVLAQISGVRAYERERCKRSDNDSLRDKCWDCDRPDSSRCIGKRGYLFYKRTIEKDNPRKASDFFRDPPGNEGDCVLWYGAHLGCTSGTASGNTFGVLTLFKDRKKFFAPNGEANRWIILLSGFTGVATYILAQVLTTLEVTTTKKTQKEKAMVLQEALEDKGLKLGQGVQVLVSVEYDSEIGGQSYDSRTPTSFAIRDIRPLPVDQDRPSAE